MRLAQGLCMFLQAVVIVVDFCNAETRPVAFYIGEGFQKFRLGQYGSTHRTRDADDRRHLGTPIHASRTGDGTVEHDGRIRSAPGEKVVVEKYD